MASEREMIRKILEKKERGEALTERETVMLAYSPYGTAARSSFAPVNRIEVRRDK